MIYNIIYISIIASLAIFSLFFVGFICNVKNLCQFRLRKRETLIDKFNEAATPAKTHEETSITLKDYQSIEDENARRNLLICFTNLTIIQIILSTNSFSTFSIANINSDGLVYMKGSEFDSLPPEIKHQITMYERYSEENLIPHTDAA